MSSSELSTLRVRSGHDAVEVSVLDSSFGIVAEGTGDVDAELPPGLYELQLRVGPTEERRLFKLEAGAVHEELVQLADPNTPPAPGALRLAVPSAAPVDGTSTTREEHMRSAHLASSALTASGAHGGVVLMVRVLRGSNAPLRRDVVERVSLVDADSRPLAADWRVGRSWATAVHPLSPGGYGLRVEPPGISTLGPTFQSVWVAEGWQSLVFVASTDEGLAPDRAAVHMTGMHDPWNPESDRRDVDLAAEAARWSLREGHPEISPRLLRLLLETKFRNPMLGIFGAHVQLLNPKPKLGVLAEVIRNLSNLVPGHPDVRALGWLLEDAGGGGRDPDRDRGVISWPPMLALSYAAAIRRDAYEPGAIGDGSPAEALAAHLITTGIWTSWREPPRQDDGGRGPALALRESDAATARVLSYVEAVADRSGETSRTVLENVDVRQCALGTGLPTAVAHRALTQVREGLA